MLNVNSSTTRGVVAGAVFALALPALGQIHGHRPLFKTFSLPFLLQFEDGSGGIGWNATGGQPSVHFEVDATGPAIRRSYTPVRSLWAIGQSAGMFGWLADAVTNPSPQRMNIKMYSAAREATTRASHSSRITGATFPGCDSDQKESRGVEIEFVPTEMQRLAAHELAHVVQQSAKKQKMWLCSNFRLTIGDLPTQRVSKVDAFTLKLVNAGDLDGDGDPDSEFVMSDFAFELPSADRRRMDEEMTKALDGNPSALTVFLEYLDGDGQRHLGVRMTCQIKAVGMSNPFADPPDPDEPVRIELILDQKNKKITLETRNGDID